jgi:putative DNA primase/helicase
MSIEDVRNTVGSSEKPQETTEEIMARLARLPYFEYEQVRKEEAKKLNIRISMLDGEVSKLRPRHESGDDAHMILQDVEPWHEEVSGQVLFADLVGVFSKYLALQKHQPEALALWSIFSYCIDANNIAPKLLVYSPEKRCGKTTLLDVLIGLVWKGLPASNITPAAIFRTIESIGGTIIIDEADTFINETPEINGIINSGHRKSSAFVIRLVGDSHEPKQFSTWAPNIIAMIGKPKDTIVDRSIMIEMRRKKPDERVARFIPHRANPELKTLARKIKRWSIDNFDTLRDSDPETPLSLNDRAADNWRPLFAIADLISKECSKLSRIAAIGLSEQEEEEAGDSVGTVLLADVREIFFTESDCTGIFTESLLRKLYALENRPWIEWNRGKPISAHQMAKYLRPFKIAPQTIRIGIDVKKGYKLCQFIDAFSRYLSDAPVTKLQPTEGNRHSGNTMGNMIQNVTGGNRSNTMKNKTCNVVTDEIRPIHLAQDLENKAINTETKEYDNFPIKPLSIYSSIKKEEL